jgi:DNA anti-recombination protein RmuC
MKEYQIKISNTFAALENLNDNEDINWAWENMKEMGKTSVEDSLSLYELRQYKPWFDEKRSQFLGERKQVRMHCLQDLNQSNTDNLNNIRREASIHFKNQKKEFLKAKIDEFEIDSKIKIS